MPASPLLKISLASDLAYIEAAAGACCVVAKHLGFSDTECSDICLALRESLNNAIIHGNRNGDARTVRIRISGEPGRIVLLVRDEGGGFDPKVIPDPTAPENLLKPCGRGIFLMRHLMDDVTFRFRSPTGTEVRLVRHRRPGGREDPR